MRPVLPSTHQLWRRISAKRRFTFIAGPCVLEPPELGFEVARVLKRICSRHDQVNFIFKASFDKANRTSAESFRGPGLEAGLEALKRIRSELRVPVLTDIHREEQAGPAADCVDILQIPAFLCRQTDLVAAAVATGRIVNLKKGQFLSPPEMGRVVEKAVRFGGRRLLLTERGSCFGYQNLVADMRAIPMMKPWGFPVIFDATHSVQLPGGEGNRSGGQREFAPVLARCAVAAGADGLFVETHPDPDSALSDGPNMIPLEEMAGFLKAMLRLYALIS